MQNRQQQPEDRHAVQGHHLRISIHRKMIQNHLRHFTGKQNRHGYNGNQNLETAAFTHDLYQAHNRHHADQTKHNGGHIRHDREIPYTNQIHHSLDRRVATYYKQQPCKAAWKHTPQIPLKIERQKQRQHQHQILLD